MAASTRQTPVRWGLLGASRIAVREFLPALRQEDGGRAEVVGARDPARAERFAAQHGIARSVGGYQAVLEDPDVDAVYVALPNDLHTRWAAAAARAGKAVLCEKPLGLDEADVSGLAAAAGAGALIWEAMVFPFHPQTERLRSLIAAELGGITRIESDFSFVLDNAADFRWDPAHGGGALYDIGCYCIRLARLLIGAEPDRADAAAVLADTGVDVSTDATLHFPGGATCRFSCSFARPFRSDATITGPGGSITATNPFHPSASDVLILRRADGTVLEWSAPPGSSFSHGLGHIHRVLRGEQDPRYLVDPESIQQARAMDLVRGAAKRTG
jgi:predicted dehydrogenase